ncbi:MAG TPA: tetratricopeptide repeat protein [Pyrinomonadaceae bacterium]|jgi:tetratricopeptide (TPR) repeat protein|nr:tetratricopeptide repeat protein [Pyrinomonadaceae bacterium]
MISQLKEFFTLKNLLGNSIIPLLAFLTLGYIQRNVYDWTKLNNAGYERSIEIGGYLIINFLLYSVSRPLFWLRPQLKVKVYKEGSSQEQPETSHVFDFAHRKPGADINKTMADINIELEFVPNFLIRRRVQKKRHQDLGIKLLWSPDNLFSCESRHAGDKIFSKVLDNGIYLFPFGKMEYSNFSLYSFRFALGTTEVVERLKLKPRHLNWKSRLLFGLISETEFLFDVRNSEPRITSPATEERASSPQSAGASTEDGSSPLTVPAPSTGRHRRVPGLASFGAAWPRLSEHKVLSSAVTTVLFIALLFSLYYLRGGEPAVKRINSLAVLPFTYEKANAAGIDESEYLPRGIPGSIIEGLSKVQAFKIARLNSVIRYNGTADPQRVGQELNVRAVMVGKIVQMGGHHYQVITDLWDTQSRNRIGGETIDYTSSDLHIIPAKIAQEIIEKLQLGLTPDEQKEVNETFTNNAEAFMLYLKGRTFWDKRGEDNLKKASEYFKQAIDKDQDYALAYAGLADCNILLGYYSYLKPKDSFPLAEEAAQHAIKLDPDLAEAHTSLAYVTGFYKWDWGGADAEFNKAIKLDPNYATAHHWYALFLARRGQPQAHDQINTALDLDQNSLIINRSLGLLYYYEGKYSDAIQQFQKTIDIDPNYSQAYVLQGRAYALSGNIDEAINSITKAQSIAPEDPSILPYLGWAYALSGNVREAKKIRDQLRQIEDRSYISPFDEAVLYVGLKDYREAFKLLDKAYDEQSDKLVSLKVDPIFNDLRTNANYAKLLRGMNLEP